MDRVFDARAWADIDAASREQFVQGGRNSLDQNGVTCSGLVDQPGMDRKAVAIRDVPEP
jgi:hypothetical protein